MEYDSIPIVHLLDHLKQHLRLDNEAKQKKGYPRLADTP
jgi:hypothetical protein